MKREFQYNGKTVTYYRIAFILSNTTQRYEKQPMIRDFKKIPTDLKIEETHDPKIRIRSEYLLRGRRVNGKCTLHLGLEKSKIEKMYRIMYPKFRTTFQWDGSIAKFGIMNKHSKRKFISEFKQFDASI